MRAGFTRGDSSQSQSSTRPLSNTHTHTHTLLFLSSHFLYLTLLHSHFKCHVSFFSEPLHLLPTHSKLPFHTQELKSKFSKFHTGFSGHTHTHTHTGTHTQRASVNLRGSGSIPVIRGLHAFHTDTPPTQQPDSQLD